MRHVIGWQVLIALKLSRTRVLLVLEVGVETNSNYDQLSKQHISLTVTLTEQILTDIAARTNKNNYKRLPLPKTKDTYDFIVPKELRDAT